MSAEALLAIAFAAGIVLAGGGVIYFVATMSIHGDPASVPSVAAGPTPEGYAGAVEQARRVARSVIVDENLPALSVAVAHDGRLVWAEAFGYADVERRVPATPLTRFRLGAASKPLTAAGVGLLRDRGRLDLDAPVQQYVRAYPSKQWPVSTRQLMGDVAGVQHRRDGTEGLPDHHCAGLEDGLEIFRDDPLLFRPGTQYRYSVYGWVLVSAVVEGAAAEPFSRFMAREVFGPLGMENTVLDEVGRDARRASFYFPRMAARTSLGPQSAESADYSCWAGAGALLSTPSDLARFGAAMLKPGFLSAETLALLHTPLRLESGKSTDYALGWKMETVTLSGSPTRVFSHRGSPIGGSTTLMTFPDLDLVVAATTNESHAASIVPFALKVAEAFAKR
jgi:CubicO group peptidase (beta-lactamase class C family)